MDSRSHFPADMPRLKEWDPLSILVGFGVRDDYRREVLHVVAKVKLPFVHRHIVKPTRSSGYLRDAPKPGTAFRQC